MDMRHDVTTTDDAGAETMQNQLLQYVKCISLNWLKYYIIYLINENRGKLTIDELNGIEKTIFNNFRGSYGEMPKLAMTTTPNPSHPILAAHSCCQVSKEY